MAYYQRRILATSSSFNQENNGVWSLADCNGDGSLDLCYIKTRNCESGTIEVHWTTSESGFQAPCTSTGTPFLVADAQDGTFLMQDFTGNGKADLVYIKTRNTVTDTVEVHVASAETKYQQFVWQTGSAFALEDNGYWFMSDNRDLVFIKTRNTPHSMVEYHVVSRDSGYEDFTVHEATEFHSEHNGTWLIGPKSNGRYPDLYYIKTRNTGARMVEVHVSSASSSWKNIILSTGTGFDIEANGQWTLANWTRQSFADLVYIKTQKTGTGKVEVFINEYRKIRPASWAQSAQAISVAGNILTAELKRNDGSWRVAQVDLDMFLGNNDGEFAWGLQDFSATARKIRLDGYVLEAELKCLDGFWLYAECELSRKLLNNDGVFQGPTR